MQKWKWIRSSWGSDRLRRLLTTRQIRVDLCEDGLACPLCQVEHLPFLSWQQFREIAGIANLYSEGRQRNRVSKRSRQFRSDRGSEVEQSPDAVGLWKFHMPPYQERLQEQGFIRQLHK